MYDDVIIAFPEAETFGQVLVAYPEPIYAEPVFWIDPYAPVYVQPIDDPYAPIPIEPAYDAYGPVYGDPYYDAYAPADDQPAYDASTAVYAEPAYGLELI